MREAELASVARKILREAVEGGYVIMDVDGVMSIEAARIYLTEEEQQAVEEVIGA